MAVPVPVDPNPTATAWARAGQPPPQPPTGAVGPAGPQGPPLASTYTAAPQPINPKTGQPFTPQDLISSGEFTANTGVYGPPQGPPSAADIAADKAKKGPPPPYQYPDFMTPAMQKYVDQFESSQASQQQAVNSGLVSALQGLGQRRDAASHVAATLPGEFDKAYAHATQSQHQAAADARGAFGGPTLGDASQPIITAANTQQQAAGHANQPLLEAGITADYSKGATTLDNTHMQNQAEIAQAQQQFDQQMLQSQAQYQQAQAQQQAGFSHDEHMARLTSTLGQQDFRAQHPGGVQTPQAQALDSQAINNGFTSYAAQKAAEGSGDYGRAVNVLAGKTDWFVNGGDQDVKTGKADTKQKLVSVLASNPDVLKALVANGFLTAADVYGVSNVAGKQNPIMQKPPG